MIDNVKDLIIRHEGIVPHAYQDSLGYWTIGVGHLIDKRRGGRLSKRIIELILEEDLEDVRRDLPAWISSDTLGPVRCAVLVDMAFNLGVAGLLGFTNTLKAVQEGRYEDASVLMMQSKWAKQVGPRASRLSLMMKTGEWPEN